LNVDITSAVLLNAIMPNVVAPCFQQNKVTFCVKMLVVCCNIYY
jgi:hypothetical protein